MDYQQSLLYQLIAVSLLWSGSVHAEGLPDPSLNGFPTSIPAITEMPLQKARAVGALLSLGAPQLAEIGVNYWKDPKWNFFIEGGYVPLPLTATGTLGVLEFESGTQFHFLQNAFFVGLAAGYQSVSYGTTVDFSSFSADLGPQASQLGVRSFYVSPSIGFLWRKSSGFMIGFDIGAGIPVFSSGRLDVSGNSPLAASVGSASEGALGYFASLVMPRIHLIRLGWLF